MEGEYSSMFTRHDNAGYRESLPGIRQKTLAYGEKTLTVEHLCGALGGAHK